MKTLKKLLKVGIGITAALFFIGILIDRIEQKKRIKKSEHQPAGIYEAYLKRPLDFTLAALVLLIFWPIYLILALLVRVRLGSPVLFTQERPGRDEEIFKLYKFRSMTDERDENGELLPDDVRLTPFGAKLRSTSLDELPELFNILKGEMSFVGPRPLLVRYLPYYNDQEKKRHDVRPGLTGYAQVHGRNAVSWGEKFKMDVQYADNISFFGDLRILLDTIKTVVSHEGISSETSVTMESFVDYCEEQGRISKE